MYFYVFISTLCKSFVFSTNLGGKRLENNFGPSVKQSDKKNQNGCKNPRWLLISSFLSHYPHNFCTVEHKIVILVSILRLRLHV